MGGVLSRWLNRRKEAAARRADEEAQMSPAERRFLHEGVEGHQADEFVEEHLGSVDPKRLLPDEGAPPED